VNFEEIYRMYFRDVYLFLLALCREQSLAEELTQETFYKVLCNIDKYKEGTSMKAWLFQIGKNTLYNYRKKAKRLTGEAPLESAEDTSEDVEAFVINKEASMSAYKALHSLAEPYREVFTLRALVGMSFRDIGEVFGRGEGWARVTHHRAKQKLAELLRRDEDEQK